MIEIWSPRWHDRKALVAKYKVGEVNDIVFTKASQLRGKKYRLTRQDIVSCPMETNGKIECFAVPLDTLLEKEVA